MQIENPEYTVISSHAVGLEKSTVLRKTYFLLGLTILFSAVMATLPLFGMLPIINSPALCLLGMFGLLFAAQATAHSDWGIFWTFAFTGFMGYTLAPTLIYYLMLYSNGGAIVLLSLFCTALIFMALSFYAVYAGKDFSYLSGMLFVGLTVGLLLSIAGLFLQVEWFSVVTSGFFVLIMAGLILLRTNWIVNGGERNYIVATISLYLSLLNMFISLLQILGFFAGSKRN